MVNKSANIYKKTNNHLKQLNSEKTTRFGFGNLGSGLG